MDIFGTNFATLDWWIVGVYLAGSVIVGLLANRYIHNVAGFMVGGRGSGAALNAATYIGTGLGLVTIMYSSIDGFHKGFTYMVLGLIGVTMGVTLGSTGFVLKRLRQHRLTTLPEFFQLRYSRGVRVTAGAICATAGILNMGLFPKMGATFITYATGLGRTEQAVVAPPEPGAPSGEAPGTAAASQPQPDEAAREKALSKQQLTVNLITSVLIVIVLFYTVLGGMVSVIVTDYIQFIILSVGLGLGLYFCLVHPDIGWQSMVSTLAENRGEAAFNPFHSDSYGWVWVLWMLVHVFAAGLCWAPEATRALTAKDPTTSRRTYLIASPGQFVRLALPALLAIAAFCYFTKHPVLSAYFFPNGPAEGAAHAGQALPLLLGKIVPSGLLGLLVAGLMAAFMSTHDSYFLCWSSVICRDVVGPLRKEPLDDKQQILLTRGIIVAIGLFLLVWGVWYELPASVWNYMAVTGSVYLCGSIVVLVGGMYWKGASSAGAMAALLGGLISVVVIFLPAKITSNTMLMGIVGLGNYAFCIVAFIVFSLLIPDRPDDEGVIDLEEADS